MTTRTSETGTFGALLRQHRLAASLSQEVLGQRAHLSVNAIAALERGRRIAPRPSTVVLLADALSLTPAERAALVSAAVPEKLGGLAKLDGLPLQPPPLDRRRHNLPAELTSFVGRRKELLELPGVLASSRLLSLTGAGGVGKTRLALQLARDVMNKFPDGVWLVDLAPLSAPDLVAQTIASAVGVREGPQRSARDALLDNLRDRELLLVLDNCEHHI